MKKQSLNPMLVLSSALGALLLTGCASNPAFTNASPPVSALAFTTDTNPRSLTKWPGIWMNFQRNLRSIDTYYFEVPDTGYRPGGSEPAVIVTAPPAAGAPGTYQSGTQAYRVIRYRPGLMQ